MLKRILADWRITLSSFELTGYVVVFGIFIYELLQYEKTEPLIAFIIALFIVPSFGYYYRQRFQKIKNLIEQDNKKKKAEKATSD